MEKRMNNLKHIIVGSALSLAFFATDLNAAAVPPQNPAGQEALAQQKQQVIWKLDDLRGMLNTLKEKEPHNTKFMEASGVVNNVYDTLSEDIQALTDPLLSEKLQKISMYADQAIADYAGVLRVTRGETQKSLTTLQGIMTSIEE